MLPYKHLILFRQLLFIIRNIDVYVTNFKRTNFEMSIDREKIKRFLNESVNLLDENSRGAKIGCYSVALIGLIVSVRRVRPFSRFKKPSDIPKKFVENRQELVGTVDGIEPNNGLLLINHKPLISLPFSNKIALPVKISGIEVTRNGISWLQTIVVGNEVKFIPISIKENWAQCEVILEELDHKIKPNRINVGESLVAVGFASLNNIDETTLSVQSKQYYRRLQLAEVQALRKMLGFRFYLRRFEDFLLNTIKRILSTKTRSSQKLNVTT